MGKQGETTTKLTCYHCGEDCLDEVYYVDEKPFCCFGCKTVYGILAENDLCTYYDLEAAPEKIAAILVKRQSTRYWIAPIFVPVL